MNRRRFFSLLAATPVGVVAAGTQAKASLAETTDIPVKVTPGEKCIHCGCPQHHFIYNEDVHYPGYCQAKKVCSWCNFPWG